MIRKIGGLVSLAVALAAVVLLLAAPADAGTQTRVRLVAGSDAFGEVSGSLQGQIVETPDTFALFLATRRLTPSGIFTWRTTVDFKGCFGSCLDGNPCGTLHLDGHYLYRFEPRTTLYDFELGGPQLGTTGDEGAWKKIGGNISVITGGDGCFTGASGVIAFRETAFLSAHTYVGVVRI